MGSCLGICVASATCVSVSVPLFAVYRAFLLCSYVYHASQNGL